MKQNNRGQCFGHYYARFLMGTFPETNSNIVLEKMITITQILHSLQTNHDVKRRIHDSTATVTVLKEFYRCLESHLEGKLTQLLEISWTFPGNLYVVVQLCSVFLRCLGKI